MKEIQINLTELEIKVLDYLLHGLSVWMGAENFSDIDHTDVGKGLKLPVSTIKGVIGSLCKKKILDTWDLDNGTGISTILFLDQEHIKKTQLDEKISKITIQYGENACKN